MPPNQTCPNCTDRPVRVVFTIPSGDRVVECLGCGLQFAESYPEYEVADSKIYSYEYFQDAIEKNPKREKIFAELVGELESSLKRKGRLLDVGAGEGALLEVANGLGWEVEGTELSTQMVDHVRDRYGFEIHRGLIEDIDLPAASFDAVVMNHVLEHVKNPVTTLEKIASLLRPDGIVRIEVPNLAGLSSRVKNRQSRMRLKKNPWKHYATGHHFWFFTPDTLAGTVEASGLELITMRALARQWGKKNLLLRTANAVCRRTLWGGHLVAYARPRD